MKKLFNITAEFDLTKKPDWLDGFRAKYDKPYRYHVTFKTNTFLESNNFDQLKADLKEIAQKHNKVKVTFDTLFTNVSPRGHCIMIRAKESKELTDLQKEISARFARYGSHINKQYKEFEENFTPHLTIGRHLTKDQLQKALKEVGRNLFCETLISELILTTVTEDDFSQWVDEGNKVKFWLK